MADVRELASGTRVAHPAWHFEGVIVVSRGRRFVKFDGVSPPAEVREGGDVEPGDLDVIAASPRGRR